MLNLSYRFFEIIAKPKIRLLWLLIILDLSNLIYLRSRYLSKFSSPEYIRKLFHYLKPDLRMNEELLFQTQALMTSTLSLVLCFFIVFNFVMYFLNFKEKIMGLKFVKGYSLCAVILTFLEILTFKNNFSMWILYLLFSIYLYYQIFRLTNQTLESKN